MANPVVATPQEGYSSFSAFLGHSADLQNFRRFRVLRMRMLLLKQDAVVQLEEKLEKIDNEETKFVFLGNSRLDKNEKRIAVLQQLDDALEAYGTNRFLAIVELS
jgi:hypothetical protein